jgi:succinate dehydrogenase/fumarate reductase cytochrome b subunit
MKKTIITYAAIFAILPAITQAQSLQILFTSLPKFIDKVLIPFLFGIAFLFFIYNTVRYFVLEGHSEEGRDKAKAHILYSIAAFVFLIVFYGIVYMLADSSGLENKEAPCIDYLEMKGGCTPPGG